MNDNKIYINKGKIPLWVEIPGGEEWTFLRNGSRIVSEFTKGNLKLSFNFLDGMIYILKMSGKEEKTIFTYTMNQGKNEEAVKVFKKLTKSQDEKQTAGTKTKPSSPRK